MGHPNAAAQIKISALVATYAGWDGCLIFRTGTVSVPQTQIDKYCATLIKLITKQLGQIEG